MRQEMMGLRRRMRGFWRRRLERLRDRVDHRIARLEEKKQRLDEAIAKSEAKPEQEPPAPARTRLRRRATKRSEG